MPGTQNPIQVNPNPNTGEKKFPSLEELLTNNGSVYSPTNIPEYNDNYSEEASPNSGLTEQIGKDATLDPEATKFDTEGDLINVSYTTKIGSDVITFNTTQPYSPSKKYMDQFENPQ
jgi:hypothetical protein